MFTEAMARRIEIWPVEKLVPYARNPRTHSEAQVARIAASIVEFGFVNPVLVDSDAGIIAGHGRLLAAKKLRLTQVPVIVLDHLSPAQRRAYLLADNKLAEQAGWDEELLRVELKALDLEDFDLGVIGFSDEELKDLFEDTGASTGLTDEDAAPEVPARPVSRVGDLWLLGQHRVLVRPARSPTPRAAPSWLEAGSRSSSAAPATATGHKTPRFHERIPVKFPSRQLDV
jgi:hypothetical protein